MREIVFTHSGNLGDILFSLHFIRDYSEWRGADRTLMLLTYGKPAVYGERHPDGDVQMSERSARFIIPFLRESGLFTDVQAAEWAKVEQIRGQIDGCVDLDEFRQKRISFYGGDNRLWFYALSSHHFRRDLSENLFEGKFEGDGRAAGKVLVTCTERVNNYYVPISYCLSEHRDGIAFIGLDSEHRRLESLTGYPVPKIEIADMADAARLMKGAKGVIGNQGGLWSLAEMLKVPRLLLAPEYMKMGGALTYGPCVVHPLGGECDVVQTIEQSVHLPDFLFE